MANKVSREVFKQGLIDEIKANKAVYGITNVMIGERLSLDRKTVAKKLDNPELLVVWELIKLTEYLKLKPTTVSAFIYGDAYVTARN